jgi:hypothetical protein
MKFALDAREQFGSLINLYKNVKNTSINTRLSCLARRTAGYNGFRLFSISCGYCSLIPYCVHFSPK